METTTRRPAARTCTPYPAGAATDIALTLDDASVLAVSRRLHDEKCVAGAGCSGRDRHALDSFEPTVRKTLGALVGAQAAKEI